MSVEDILLPEEVTLQVEDLSEQRTLLSELFEKKTLQSEMLEPRQIFGEKFLQSAEEDVYESRSRILCEHGVDLELHECASSSVDSISISSLARKVERVSQRYPRHPPVSSFYPYMDCQGTVHSVQFRIYYIHSLNNKSFTNFNLAWNCAWHY